MTDHITAAELRGEAESARMWQQYATQTAFHRAAAALDAKDARIAELEGEVAALRSERDGFCYDERITADAELGALVRRWRDHPERPGQGSICLCAGVLAVKELQGIVAAFDAIAASREAERGVEGPSGRRYRLRAGRLERLTTADSGEWYAPLACYVEDILTVAALIERHGGKDGE